MADEDRKEQEFFTRRPVSTIGEMVKPPTTARKITVAVLTLIVLAAVFFFVRPKASGVLWVMNPGPGLVTVDVAGQTHELDEGLLLDLKVPASPTLEVTVVRGRDERVHTVDVGPANEGVTILDLAGDAAYVIADVSSRYRKTNATDSLELVDISPPAEVHHLAYMATKLVRPGKPLPSNDSWELQLVPQGPDGGLEVFKVFRVMPKRLDDKEKLVSVLSEAMKAALASDYENLLSVADTSTTGGMIPPSKNVREPR
jgi:hypothetical protein